MMSDVLGEGWGPWAGMPRSQMEFLQSLPVGEFEKKFKSSKKKPLKRYKVIVEKFSGPLYTATTEICANSRDSAERQALEFLRTAPDESFVSADRNETKKSVRFYQL